MDYRNYCEIDLSAIAYNLTQIKQIIGSSIKVLGVVKADAYGHGAVSVSEALIKNGIDYLGVATLEEAMEIRETFKDVPILVFGFIPQGQIKDAIINNITQTIYNNEVANQISECANSIGLDAKVHIKMDTGMNRVGFWGSQLKEIYLLKKLPNLDIEGIYTHFSCADCDEEYTKKQFSRFIIVCEKLKENGFDIKYRHCCNSSAIINFPEMHLDMVRPGIALYGLEPHLNIDKEKINLKPAMSFVSKITHIKNVPSESKISYGATYQTTRDSVIATISAGYADGFSRGLSNNISVIINGEYAPVLGKICMDSCMADVTDIKNVKILDEAVIFGKQREKEISVNEIAKKLNTISYEIICSIGKRVHRIYIN